MLRTQLYAKPTQGRDTVGHQPFGANFIDERAGPIRDYNVKSTLAGRKRGSESGWTAPNYEDISFRWRGTRVHHRTKIISGRTRGPIGNGKPYIPSCPHMDLTTRCAIPSASDQKLLPDLCINCTTCSTADTNRSSCASLTTSGGEIFNTMKSLPQT